MAAFLTQFIRPGNTTKPAAAVDPVAEFDKSWFAVKNTLLYPDERQLARGIQSTNVIDHLESIVQYLVRERATSDDSTAGGCLEYLLKNDVLGCLVRLSEPDRPFGIQAEVLRMIIKLVSALDEHFLVHSGVHKAVIRLLRTCVGDEIDEMAILDGKRPMGAASASVPAEPSEYELELVDLLCTLCTRIRAYPELLLIFLHDKNWNTSYTLPTIDDADEDEEEETAESTAVASSSSSQRPPSPTPSATSTVTASAITTTTHTNSKPEYEFLIFNYLLRFVHREGKIGDLARGGILSLIDIAMTAGESQDEYAYLKDAVDPVAEAALALAEYILDGDFSDVLCAGLGAVYSALPTKLEIHYENQAEQVGSGMTLGGLSEDEQREQAAKDEDRTRALGVVPSNSPAFRTQLDHFLKLLDFVQDVLLRCTVTTRPRPDASDAFAPAMLVGSAITQAIQDAFRTTFLKNVLYPSILECSDADGSSVAVMAYIDEMLKTITEASVADLLITFLMSEDEDDENGAGHSGEPRLPRHKAVERVLSNNPSSRASKRASTSAATKASRRKSSAMILLEYENAVKNHNEESPDYFSSLGRFTLKDLLLSNIRSENQRSATAALRLAGSLFMEHCHLTVEDGLVKIIRDPLATNFPQPNPLHDHRIAAPAPRSSSPTSDDEEEFVYPGTNSEDIKPSVPSISFNLPLFPQPEVTLAAHEREVELYLGLVRRIIPFDPLHPSRDSSDSPFSTSFSNYVHDAVSSIQRQSCFTPSSNSALSMPRHRLIPTDPFLRTLLRDLRLFFSNTPEHNLTLTGVLASICACPHRGIGGWLTLSTTDETELGGGASWADWDTKASTLGAFGLPKTEEDEGDYSDDGDDRSVDFRVDELLASGMKPSTRRRGGKDSEAARMPVLYTVMAGLVDQLDRYRMTVEDFDRYLEERRQGLLFTENISDALGNLDLHRDIMNDRAAVLSAGSGSSAFTTPLRPALPAKAKSTIASVTSFFTTPTKKKAPVPAPSPAPPLPALPNTPLHKRLASHGAGTDDTHVSFPASPFTPHYKQTGSIDVQPYLAPPPSAGPWSPVRGVTSSITSVSLTSFSLPEEEEDIFSTLKSSSANAGLTPDERDEEMLEMRARAKVTLSQLLDNVVILEESMKELAALVQVRRSMGIDSVRFI